ncbi:hypothetical protein WA026_003776 [Henosepilachna vigintioctopunctata]|uniref:Transferrin-like domain-containing protein n=1 Tax=Henosepilachna vigintioctopunctata TaxID=420089 RepID=A0AAW1UFM8_9CUCU
MVADNTTHCMDAVHRHFADVVVVDPDLLNLARNSYQLKTLFYETVRDENKYLTVAVSKRNSGFSSLEDLEGTKACFPMYDGVAWNTVAYTLKKNNLLPTCPEIEGMANFFGQSCVPGLVKNESYESLNGNCDEFKGDDGAIRCLLQDVGSVAFVSKNSLKNFISDSTRNKKNATIKDFKIICEDPDSEDCILSWAPVGHAMIRKNTSDLWMKDTLDVFFAIDSLFGKNYKSLTAPFTLFGTFNGKSNLLFHDVTLKFRSQPMSRNLDKMKFEYDQVILEESKCRSSSTTLPILNSLYLVMALYGIQNAFILW